jgi:hypothetical protein
LEVGTTPDALAIETAFDAPGILKCCAGPISLGGHHRMIIYQEKISPPQAPLAAEDLRGWSKTDSRASDRWAKKLLEALGSVIRNFNRK